MSDGRRITLLGAKRAANRSLATRPGSALGLGRLTGFAAVVGDVLVFADVYIRGLATRIDSTRGRPRGLVAALGVALPATLSFVLRLVAGLVF
ncbi:MAG TPA: hypothetical protein VN903_19150 [Polyangia bacterium]|nr:hypothetical protein [Polyangia bacterium]